MRTETLKVRAGALVIGPYGMAAYGKRDYRKVDRYVMHDLVVNSRLRMGGKQIDETDYGTGYDVVWHEWGMKAGCVEITHGEIQTMWEIHNRLKEEEDKWANTNHQIQDL